MKVWIENSDVLILQSPACHLLGFLILQSFAVYVALSRTPRVGTRRNERKSDKCIDALQFANSALIAIHARVVYVESLAMLRILQVRSFRSAFQTRTLPRLRQACTIDRSYHRLVALTSSTISLSCRLARCFPHYSTSTQRSHCESRCEGIERVTNFKHPLPPSVHVFLSSLLSLSSSSSCQFSSSLYKLRFRSSRYLVLWKRSGKGSKDIFIYLILQNHLTPIPSFSRSLHSSFKTLFYTNPDWFIRLYSFLFKLLKFIR